MTFKSAILSPSKFVYFNEIYIVVMDVVITLLVPAESDNTRVVITLFMT